MARRTSNKIEPAVQTLIIPVPASAVGVTSYIDLSQLASLVNRRFYRQGLNWAVAGFKFVGTGTGVIQISKLPNTWVMSNSWEKGMRTWLRMNNEALAETESVKPKFLDYKIYADADHHASGYGANLLPTAGFNAPAGTFTYNRGEWESAKMIIPDSSAPGTVKDVEVIAVGANYPPPGASGLRAVSLIEGYANSRGLPNILDPNTPDDADDTSGPFPQNWINATFNDGTEQSEEVLDDLTSENNVAPYPFENGPVFGGGVYADTMYPNGANNVPYLQTHDYSFVTTSTIGGITRLKGGNFPCGLIRLDVISDNDTIQLQIDLVPGHHRGYLCEPMTEM